MSQDTAYLVGQMMRATTQKGTCTALSGLPYEVHAKSGTNGTTNKSLNTDAICIAQTSEHTACVWYFSKDNTEENLLPNASVSQVSPTQNIKHLFKKIYKNDTPKDFEKPDSIITLDIDSQSYLDGNVELASPSTPAIYTRQEIFSKNNQPQLVSKTFSNIKNTNLTSIQNGEDITLTFDTIPYQRYELIKVTKKS